MKTLRLAVPLVLAAFTLTCQRDQTTPVAPDDLGIRAAPGGVPGPNPDRPAKRAFAYTTGGGRFAPDVSLFVIDARRAVVKKEIALPDGGGRIEITPDNRHAWMVGGSVTVIGIPNHTIEATLSRPGSDVDFSPDGKLAYLTSGQSLVIIDTESMSVLSESDLGTGLSEIEVLPSGDVAFVVTGQVSFSSVNISQGTIESTFTNAGLNSAIGGIALSPDGGLLYVVDAVGDGGAVLDTETMQFTGQHVGCFDDRDIVVGRDGTRYIAGDEGGVCIFGPGDPGPLPAFEMPIRLAVSPDGALMYVSEVAPCLTAVDLRRAAVIGLVDAPPGGFDCGDVAIAQVGIK